MNQKCQTADRVILLRTILIFCRRMKKTLQNSFAEILDIRRENFCRHETAAQSYALYSSARMLEEYESNQKREYRKNPFLEHDDLKYFSIIHIYLTPEIIARMDYHTDDMWNDTEGIIMKPFADDIYQVLDMFQADHPGEMFAARLYVLLPHQIPLINIG